MPVKFSYPTGNLLYVRFDNGSNTAVDLDEGIGLQSGVYSAPDIDIVGLPAGEYLGRVFLGSAGTQSSADISVGVFSFSWSGSAELPASANVIRIEGTDATDSLDARLAAYGALKPTVAGRTLDVTATGEAGIDWANIGSPTTAQTLSNTTINAVATLAGGPVENIPVPSEFTIVVPTRGSTNLAGARTIYVQPTERLLLAMDFAAILHAGDSLSSIVSVTESESETVTLTAAGVMGTQAKFWVENITANAAHRVEVKVNTRFGLTLEGDGLVYAAD